MSKLETQLAQLETAQLVRRVPDELATYIFRHVLVQDAARESLLNQERRRLHRVVAGTLEQMYADRLDEYAAVLAQHYLETDDAAKTVEFAVRAARVDCRVFAYPEARSHYAHALDALARMPDSPSNRRQKIDIALRLLEIHWSAGTPEQDLAFLDELEKSALELVAGEDASTEDRLQLARIHSAKGGVYFEMNQTTAAIRVSQQIRAEAKELGDEDLMATSLVLNGSALSVQGSFADALPLIEQAWKKFKHHPERWEWSCLIFLGVALAQLGRINEARALVHAEWERLDRSSASPALTFACFGLSIIAWLEGSMDAMLEYGRQVVKDSRAQDDPVYLYIGLALQALGESGLGQADAARAHMQESRRLREKMGPQIFLNDWVGAMNAQTALELGDLDDALHFAGAACELAQSVDGSYAQGIAQRTWAEALMRMQPPRLEQAEAHLAESLTALEACQAPVQTARTHLAWTRFFLARNDRAAAVAHLNQALPQFETAGLTRELDETRALLTGE